MGTLRFGAKVLSLMVMVLAQPAFAAPPCAGDCDAGSSVTVDELIKGIGIALGSLGVDQCVSMDTSGDGNITVDEIVNALNNGLSGCPTFNGEFFGTVDLTPGRSATVALDVEASGQAAALVTITDAAGGLSRLLGAGGGAGAISLSTTGTVNLDTGAYVLSGTFLDGGVTRTVNLSGVLPLQASAHGTLSFQLDSITFTGSIVRGSGNPPTPTPTTAAATPTATATTGTGGPVDPNLLGTWSGIARNESTGAMKQVRIRIELRGNDVLVTDLGGNLYKAAPAAITMNAPTRTTLIYNVVGNPVIVFNLTLGANQLAGIYSATTAAIPPVIDAVGLVLTKEVPLAPDPRLEGTWSHNINPLTPQEVRLRLEIQGDGVLVTDLMGDLFVHIPSSVTARPEGVATALTYVCDSGPCGHPNPVVTLNMNLLASGRLAGAYRDDTIGGPSISVGFNLQKE